MAVCLSHRASARLYVQEAEQALETAVRELAEASAAEVACQKAMHGAEQAEGRARAEGVKAAESAKTSALWPATSPFPASLYPRYTRVLPFFDSVSLNV
eukprot:COSAG05_NODE_385_length_10486_cov_12.944835_12_plen_99_part_00